MLGEAGFRYLFEKYQKEQQAKTAAVNAKKSKKKPNRKRQSKSNDRTVNTQQHQKIAPKQPTLFTEIYHKHWNPFIEFAEEMGNVNPTPIAKYLNSV